MSDNPTPNERDLSRRLFLKTAAIGGAVLGAGLISTPAQAKMAQQAVKYQPTPKGDQRCDNCALWQGPSSCKLVDGTLSPSGWCVLYKKK